MPVQEKPPQLLWGGVEAAGAPLQLVPSARLVRAWVEKGSAGVKVELVAGGRLRVVAYDLANGQEHVLLEAPSIEALVQEALRQQHQEQLPPEGR